VWSPCAVEAAGPVSYLVLLLVLASPFVVLRWDRAVFSETGTSLLRAFVICTVCIWVLIVASVVVYERVLHYQLSTFDRDGDGSFSEDEETLEQKAAMRRVIEDTARTVAPITGAVFAIGYAGLFFGTLSVARALRRSGT
jgi:hypothetical protein